MKRFIFILAAFALSGRAGAEDVEETIARKKLEIERSSAIGRKKKELEGLQADLDEIKASIKEYDRKMGAL